MLVLLGCVLSVVFFQMIVELALNTTVEFIVFLDIQLTMPLLGMGSVHPIVGSDPFISATAQTPVQSV